MTGLGAILLIRPTPQDSYTASRFNSTEIPLGDLVKETQGPIGTRSLTVNGDLRLSDNFILSPSAQPSSATPGQIYYDQDTNQLNYFNGSQFVGLGQTVTAGEGLASTEGVLSNTGVLSVQGQTGAVSLTSGSGIDISGATITNTGILGISSTSGALTVSSDGNGNVSLTVNSGAGTVSSPGGTTGKLAKFTGVQTIADSLLSESGSTVTVTGDLSVTGTLTLGTALGVSQGGTGATSLTSNGVVIGHGSGALTAVTSGSPGECLLSTAGAPAFSACPGGGVTSLNGLTGVLSVANASGSGATITIDNATTAAKGIASFSSTNFSVSSGAVNTIQDIATSASPTFSNLILQGGSATLGTSSQAGTLAIYDGSSNTGTLQTAALGQNTVYTLPDPGGNATICLTTGNCAGSGTGVTTAGGSTNRLAKFTASQAVNDSTITDNGTTVTTSVDIVIQGGEATLGVASSQTGSLNFAHSSSANIGTITQGALTGSQTYTLPDASGSFCLTSGNCSGSGSSNTLQAAYDAGNSLTTTTNRDIDITLANTVTDSNLDIVVDTDSTGYVSITRADGAGTNDPSQLLLVKNLDTNRAQPVGIAVQGVSGGVITTAFDASDANLTNALAIGANAITGTNFSVTGLGAVTSGTINSQTISSSANFTGTMTVQGSNALTLGVTGTSTGAILFKGATAASSTITLIGQANPSSNTLTLPNETGTLCVQSSSNCGFALSSGNSNYIQNQSASDQSADFRITGTGRANTSVLTPIVDVASAGSLSLGTTTATSLTLGNAANNSSLTFNSGTGTIAIGTGAQARTINLGTGAAVVQTISVGGTGANVIAIGNTQTGGSVAIGDAMTTGTIAIGGVSAAQTGTISIGTGSGSQTINIGSNVSAGHTKSINIGSLGSGATTLNIAMGAAANTVAIGQNSSSGTITVGTSRGQIILSRTGSSVSINAGNSGDGTITIGSTGTETATINLGTGGGATAVNLGTGANLAKTVTLGSTFGTSTTTVQAGTSGVNIGTGGIANTIQIGTTTGAVTQTTNIGSNATASSTSNVNIGSSIAGTVAITGATTVTNRTSGSADTLVVGNSTSTGNIVVFKDNATTVLSLADGGAATFQNASDSTTGFRVLNAGSTPLFVIDTTNSRAYIGNPSADSTGALLVLDTKNTSGDPTEVDGGMYYNSSSSTMRCGQGTIWISCIGGLVASNTSTSTVSNTATETNFSPNWSMPASYCVAGRTLRVTAQGVYSSTSNPTLNLRVKAGSTTLAATGDQTITNTQTNRAWRLEFQMICTAAPGAAAATEDQGITTLWVDDQVTAKSWEMSNTSTVNVATDSAQTIQVSADWSAADTGNTITVRQLLVEAIGP